MFWAIELAYCARISDVFSMFCSGAETEETRDVQVAESVCASLENGMEVLSGTIIRVDFSCVLYFPSCALTLLSQWRDATYRTRQGRVTVPFAVLSG